MTTSRSAVRFPDDGDAVHALGCVALCSAHLEDAMVKISAAIQQTFPKISFPRDLQSFRLGPNAKAIRKAIDRQFKSAGKYLYKEEDERLIIRILRTIEKVSLERNKALHVPFSPNESGKITRDMGWALPLKSSREFYRLAEHLSILLEELDMLWFSVCRLRDFSPDAVYPDYV